MFLSLEHVRNDPPQHPTKLMFAIVEFPEKTQMADITPYEFYAAVYKQLPGVDQRRLVRLGYCAAYENVCISGPIYKLYLGTSDLLVCARPTSKPEEGED